MLLSENVGITHLHTPLYSVMAFSIFLTLMLLVVPAICGPLTERNVCNRDNVLRALVDKRHIDEAIPFCSKYIHVPASTVTATSSCATTTVTLIIDPLPVTTYVGSMFRFLVRRSFH